MRIRMPERPFISIVMPLYNKETGVKRSVESVLAQTFTDFELIVVNDGSTDRGPEFVRGIADERIKVYDQENQGVSVARNMGMMQSISDLIAFLDADDEWFPNYLETIVSLKKKFPSCRMFATSYIYRDPNGYEHAPLIRNLAVGFNEGILNNYFKIASQSDPPIWTSAVCINKKDILSVGGFPAGIKSGEDLLTWARLATQCKIAYSILPKAVYNLQEKLEGRPVRCPQKNDVVGQSLGRLLNRIDQNQVEDFKKYLGLWHQMRASCYLRLGCRKEATQEILAMWSYGHRGLRFWIFRFLSLIPWPFNKWTNSLFSYVKKYQRRFN